MTLRLLLLCCHYYYYWLCVSEGVILSLGIRCAGTGLLWSIGCGNWQISSFHPTFAWCLSHLEWQVCL